MKKSLAEVQETAKKNHSQLLALLEKSLGKKAQTIGDGSVSDEKSSKKTESPKE